MSRNLAIDIAGRRLEVSVTSGELIPGQDAFLLHCVVIVEDAGEPGVDDSALFVG